MAAPAGAGELSRLLEALREEADDGMPMPGAEVARRCGWSESKVSRFLNGRVVPRVEQVQAMLDAMTIGGADPRRARALQLAELLPSGHSNRQHILKSGTLRAQQRYREIEAASDHVQTSTRGIVPGPVQSLGYRRAVFASDGATDEELDALVDDRGLRHEAMLDGHERRYTQVMTEGSLRWNAGTAVMIEQCELLAQLARNAPDRIQIGIIPWWQVIDTFPMVEINLYDERAVIVNTGDGVTYVTNQRSVQVYVRDFRHLCELAIWGEAAAVEFDRIADDYRGLLAGGHGGGSGA